jgi:hypothetical protein
VHDRKQPRPYLRLALTRMQPIKRAYQAIVHQVVHLLSILQQRACVTSQSRDAGFEMSDRAGHGRPIRRRYQRRHGQKRRPRPGRAACVRIRGGMNGSPLGKVSVIAARRSKTSNRRVDRLTIPAPGRWFMDFYQRSRDPAVGAKALVDGAAAGQGRSRSRAFLSHRTEPRPISEKHVPENHVRQWLNGVRCRPHPRLC